RPSRGVCLLGFGRPCGKLPAGGWDPYIALEHPMTRPRRQRGASVQSPLETYLREINETALLSASEARELARKIEDGDREARDRGRPPTHEEIAKSLNLPKKKLAIIKKAIRVYNAAPQTDQADTGWSLDEMVMDGHSKSPDMEMVEADDLHHVLDLLDKMDKREATVLRMRFGLDDDQPKTLKEIGECLGLTRERVRQIESEALNKL